MRYVALVAVVLLALVAQGCAQNNGVGRKGDPIKASQIYAELGLGYLQEGEVERAISKLERALELNKKNAAAHHYLAEAYKQLNDPELAERHYKKAVALAPDDATILNNYGAFLCGQSRIDDAEKYFLKAAETPRYRTPELSYENIALCAMRADDRAKAETYFRKALSLMPNLPKSLYYMAQLSYGKGDYLRARAFLQRLEKARGMTEQALRLGVKVETALGDSAAAARYRQALDKRLNPASNEKQSPESQ